MCIVYIIYRCSSVLFDGNNFNFETTGVMSTKKQNVDKLFLIIN